MFKPRQESKRKWEELNFKNHLILDMLTRAEKFWKVILCLIFFDMKFGMVVLLQFIDLYIKNEALKKYFNTKIHTIFIWSDKISNSQCSV